jgi:acyl-coenzyme A thioesterase PaaI-like protein
MSFEYCPSYHPDLMDITQLPYNKFVGIERSEREGFVLSLPADERYTNHLGTVHAGALMALAEAASGEVLLSAIGHLADTIIPVVRRFECKFRKPATGSIAARASIPDSTREQLLTDLTTKGRGSIEITVDIQDQSDQHCLTATVEWFIARR